MVVHLYNGTLLTNKNYGLELMCQHWFINNNKSAMLMQDVSIRGNIMGTGERMRRTELSFPCNDC